MPYVSLDNLSRFHGRLKGYALENFAGMDMANWQKTETAGAAAFYPAPEMPLEPAVNFAFTETGPAEGTKSPDNPSSITGVSSVKVTRCGKNIIKLPFYDITKTVNGVTFTADNATGTVTVNSDGPATATSNFYLMPNGNAKLFAGENYFLSGCPDGGSVSTYYLGGSRYDFGGDYVATVSSDVGSGSSLSFNSDWTLNCIIRIVAGTTVSNLVFKPQLELGSTATAFEPYEGADYTISLNGTFYGGSVDLSTGVMTVTWWGEYVSTITNTELASTYVRTTLAVTYGHMGSGTAPTYFRSNYDDDGTYVYPRYSAGTARISISLPYEMLGLDPSTATVETARTAVESFLVQHPCFVVYRLYTPQTVQLTPTQILSLSQLDPYTPRLNTVYSDQVSVQAGYPKSPQATSTELTNAIISLGSNL